MEAAYTRVGSRYLRKAVWKTRGNAERRRLIQDGTKLDETVDDILNEIGVLGLCRPAKPVLTPETPVGATTHPGHADP